MSGGPVVLHIEGFVLRTCEDGVPRMRDTDLAERLGYERPRKIRDLIDRLVRETELEGVHVRPAVGQNSESLGKPAGRPATEYWLDREQCWLVCMHSDAPNAKPIRKLIARVFDLFIVESAKHQRASNAIWSRVLDALLAPKPADWELCFHDSLVREIAALDGYTWNGGRHPRYLRSTNRKIYDAIFSTEFGRVLKARCPNPQKGDNFSQQLTPEARDYLRAQLRVVEAVARQSAGKDDFWCRMEREYAGGLLQLPLGPGGAEA